MKRTITVLAASALALAACKKDKGGEAGGGTAAGTADTAGSGTAATKPTDPGMGSGTGAGTAMTGDRPASVTEEMVTIAEKIVTTIEKLSTDVIATGKDCKKMAEAIAANTDAVKAIKADSDAMKAKHQNDEAARAWFKSNYEKRAGDAMMGMIEHAGANCKDDKAVGEAFAKLDLMKKKEDVKMDGEGAGSSTAADPKMKQP